MNSTDALYYSSHMHKKLHELGLCGDVHITTDVAVKGELHGNTPDDIICHDDELLQKNMEAPQMTKILWVMLYVSDMLENLFYYSYLCTF